MDGKAMYDLFIEKKMSFSEIAYECGVTRSVVSDRIARYKKEQGININFFKERNVSKESRKEIVRRMSTAPFEVGKKVTLPHLRNDQHAKFFRKSASKMSKNELREVLRQAVINTR